MKGPRSGGMRMLDTIGVTAQLPEAGCPIQTIQVADGLKPGGLAFEPDDDEPLGVMHGFGERNVDLAVL